MASSSSDNEHYEEEAAAAATSSAGMELVPLNQQRKSHLLHHPVAADRLDRGGGDDDSSQSDDGVDASATPDQIFSARRLLYVSHFFAQWSEIAWQFCLVLFLAAVTNYESLVLVSSYGFAVGLAVAGTGGRVGRWIDDPSTDRLATARRLIWVENLTVLFATAFCFVLLTASVRLRNDSEGQLKTTRASDLNWFQRRFESVPQDPVSIVSMIAIHFLGATAQVMDQAFLVAIERDWVVVLSRSAATALAASDDDEIERMFRQWLSDTNVAMKQIDLSCKVAAPAVAGFLIPLFAKTTNNGGGDFRWACVAIGAANVASLIAEYACTAQIYQLIPALAVKGDGTTSSPNSTGENATEAAQNPTAASAIVKSGKHTEPRQGWGNIIWLPEGLRVYMQQSSAMGGLGLAVLYANTLTFGNGIMAAYLLHRGMKLEAVGVLRGGASAIGLLGTLAYHVSAGRLSLEATGLWSVVYQCCCLGLTIVSLNIGNDVLALSLLIAGICLSRIGLWVFDIAVTQIQQQEIPGPVRGQVGGVQQSLNACFNLLGFSIGLLFPNPKDFPVYVSAGFLSVFIASLLFSFGVYLPRRCEAFRRDESPPTSSLCSDAFDPILQ